MKLTDSEKAAVIAKIEAGLQKRLDVFELKRGSKKALTEEVAFMSGAMVAVDALCPNEDAGKISDLIPPKWFLAPMRGVSVLDPL